MTDCRERIDSVDSIAGLIKDADYYDVKVFSSRRELAEFLQRMLTYQPAWLKFLYRIRRYPAALLGLEQVGSSCTADGKFDFSPGSKVDFFTSVDFRPGEYWVGEASDKHLSAHIAVVGRPSEDGCFSYCTLTIVRYRHWTGPLYFNLIRPFHHLIVKCMGRYAAADS